MNYQIITPDVARIDQLVRLCAAHAAYERSEYDVSGKVKALSRDLFGLSPKLHCRVATKDEKYVGYITWMRQYATWDAAEYLYMDCLYLDDAYRSHGIGAALIDEMKKYATAQDIHLVQWQTPAFNVRAIKFYKRIGATNLSKERFFLKV